MATLDIITRMQNQASAGAKQLQADLRGVDSSAKAAGGGMKSFGQTVQSGISLYKNAAVAVGVVGATFKKAFDLAEEGAQLELLEDRFGRLATSIGSDADSILAALEEATGGMMTTAEMMDSASQIISLGLANNQGDVVRLATLVSELGWDMQQVILTFANNSKARLDALGLSMTDVEERTQKFIEVGHSMDEAFDLAVLEAGEAKLALLGSAADSSTGAYQRLKVRVGEATDEFKRWLAEGLTPVVEILAGDYGQQMAATIDKNIEAAESVDDLIESGQKMVRTQQEFSTATFILTGTLDDLKQGLRDQAFAIAEASDGYEDARRNLEAAFGPDLFAAVDEGLVSFIDLGNGVSIYVDELRRASQSSLRYGDDLEELTRLGRLATQDLRNRTQATIDSSTATVQYSNYLERLNQGGRELLSQQIAERELERAEAHEEAAEAAALAAETAAELEQSLADYFSATVPAIENTDSLESQIYQAALTAGASATELAELGVGLGLYSEEAAEAALQSALIRAKIDELAQAYVNEEISQHGMREELERYIAVLNGEYTASVGGATETAGHLNQEIGEQKGLVGGTREEIERYNRILSGETVTAAQNAATAYAGVAAGALEGKLGVDGLVASSDEFADGSPYEAEYTADTEDAGNEIDILKGKADETAGDYNIHFNVTSDPMPQPTGGGATGGGTGNLPAPEFAEGGFTGFGSGLAGVVHRREFVFNEEATRRLGVGFLESLHTAAKTGGGTIGPPGPGGFFGGIGAPAPPLFLGGGSAGAEGIATAAGLATSPLAGGGGDTIFNISIPVTIGSGASEQKIKRMVGAAVKEALQQLGYGAETRWRIR